MSDLGSGESRRMPRRHLMYYLDVIDLNRDASLGRLGDINKEGLLLLTSRELPPGETYAISVIIPEHLKLGRTVLEMTIKTRWSAREGRRNLFSIGCLIDSITEEDRAFIPKLIEGIGFSDGSKKIFLKNDANVYLDTEIQ